MVSDFKICAISGSLRRQSYNTAVLRVAQRLAPEGVIIELADISDIPNYNEDLRDAGSFPEPVVKLRRTIAEADALLFGMPEYNYSISGALKNAIDWVSRPPNQPFNNKAYGMLGVATGAFGTARAQSAMRAIMFCVNAFSVNAPQVMITHAAQKFDENGDLTDETARGFIRQHLQALVDLGRRLGRTSG